MLTFDHLQSPLSGSLPAQGHLFSDGCFKYEVCVEWGNDSEGSHTTLHKIVEEQGQKLRACVRAMFFLRVGNVCAPHYVFSLFDLAFLVEYYPLSCWLRVFRSF